MNPKQEALLKELKKKESKLYDSAQKRLSHAKMYGSTQLILDELYSDYLRELDSMRKLYKELIDLASKPEDFRLDPLEYLDPRKKYLDLNPHTPKNLIPSKIPEKTSEGLTGKKADTFIIDDILEGPTSETLRKQYNDWIKTVGMGKYEGSLDPAWSSVFDKYDKEKSIMSDLNHNPELSSYILSREYRFDLVNSETKKGDNYREYHDKLIEIEKYINHPDPTKNISGILREDYDIPEPFVLHVSYITFFSTQSGLNLDNLLGAYFIPSVYQIFNISLSDFHKLNSPTRPNSTLTTFYVPIKEENFLKILSNLDSCLLMLDSEPNTNIRENLKLNLIALGDLLKFGRFFNLTLKVSFIG